MINNKYRGFVMLVLTLSLILIMPINISSIYAADSTSSTDLSMQKSRNQVASECSIVPPLDVKSSLVLSIVFMCIPGILEKTQAWKEIKCDEAVCSYEAIKNSLDPSFCTKEAAFKTCKYVVGEIFAIPPMSVLEYARNFVSNLLANPVGMAWGVTAKMARDYATSCSGSCDSTVMGTSMIFLGITDIASVIQTFKDITENGFFPSFSVENNCDKLENIKSEMEKVVNS